MSTDADAVKLSAEEVKENFGSMEYVCNVKSIEDGAIKALKDIGLPLKCIARLAMDYNFCKRVAEMVKREYEKEVKKNGASFFELGYDINPQNPGLAAVLLIAPNAKII